MDEIKSRVLKIRKRYRCYGCAREFPAGSIMRFVTVVDQGEFWSSY